jgi:carbon monoxide dehydrogenase subunit G
VEIEKTLLLDAPPARVWALLLDPNAMGACVPGMESIEVLNDDEYVAVMKVKISFISARFKLRTRIVDRQAPNYLRAEGTGEDASVASSLKQVSEMWLAAREGGGTELRMKVKVDVLGRMGTFGLGVMKTKADRLWDGFGVNAASRLVGPAEADSPTIVTAATTVAPAPEAAVAPASVPPKFPEPAAPLPAPSIWARLFGWGCGRDIHVEFQRGDTRIRVRWPVQASRECAAWLHELGR